MSGTIPRPSSQARTTASAPTLAPDFVVKVRSNRTASVPAAASPSVVRLRRGSSMRSRFDDACGATREIASPAFEPLDETRSVRSGVIGSTAGQQIEIRAQAFDRAPFGGWIAQRHRAAQVHQLAAVDAGTGRRSVDQRRQDAQAAACGGIELIELEHDARFEIAHHRRQLPTAVVERGPTREIGQDDGDQLAQLRRAERAAHREVLQAIAGQLDLAEGAQHQVPVVFAERHTRRHHGADARVGGDGEPDLGSAVATAGIDQGRLRQNLFGGDPGRDTVDADAWRAGQELHQPVELAGREHAPAAAAGRQQCVDLEVGLFELQRRRVRRVGQSRAQSAVERRLGSVARDEHPVEPQSLFSADESIADTRAQRGDRNRPASRRTRLSPLRA